VRSGHASQKLHSQKTKNRLIKKERQQTRGHTSAANDTTKARQRKPHHPGATGSDATLFSRSSLPSGKGSICLIPSSSSGRPQLGDAEVDPSPAPRISPPSPSRSLVGVAAGASSRSPPRPRCDVAALAVNPPSHARRVRPACARAVPRAPTRSPGREPRLPPASYERPPYRSPPASLASPHPAATCVGGNRVGSRCAGRLPVDDLPYQGSDSSGRPCPSPAAAGRGGPPRPCTLSANSGRRGVQCGLRSWRAFSANSGQFLRLVDYDSFSWRPITPRSC